MLTDSNERLQPRQQQHVRHHVVKETSPARVNELLSKIDQSRSNFRNLVHNYSRKQVIHQNMSGDTENIDFKDEPQEEQDTAIRKQPSVDLAILAIQSINMREIRTAKKQVKDREPPSPKSSPAGMAKKISDEVTQDRLPSPRQKPLVKLGRQKKEPDMGDALRKSYLNFDMKNFKRTINGTLVRVQPLGVEQQIQHKIQELQPRANEAVILNLVHQPSSRKSPPKSTKLENIDDQLVMRYIRQHGFLDSTASANMIYEYFHNLCCLLQISFVSPLIKKYKNCVYFGQNPSEKGNYQGVLYHYSSKLYFGSFRDGKKDGRGCQINYKEGTVCRGNYNLGAKTGIFKVKGDDYDYQGTIVDGLFEGRGLLINKHSKYEGEFEKGYKHGHGQQNFNISNERYVGTYNYGHFNGQGQITSRDYFYEGSFLNNLKHGQGIEKTPQEEYRGEFLEGKRSGRGTLFMANGDSYSGNFKDGQMYGKGTYQYGDGQSVMGYFVNGRMISERQNGPKRSTSFLDNAQTRKDWSDMRQYPRDDQRELAQTSRIPFNPQKLVRLAREEPRQNFTPRLNIKRDEQFMGNRRNSDLYKPAMSSQPRGIDNNRFHSNERRRGFDFGYTANHFTARPSNNFMQLDYSIFDNSVDEESIPTFPIVPQNRLKSGHAEEPIQRRFQ